MEPPIYNLCVSSPEVIAVFGAEPRVYPHGDAGECEGDEVPQLPYATWFRIGGMPSNTLGDRPGSDRFFAQFDVWHDSRQGVLDAARVLRDMIEGVADIESWRGAARDPVTRWYGVSFDVNFHVKR